MSALPLLEIKNLTTEFRTENETVVAVNNISFTLNKGETIGIVGESGSGKSVTSLSVMRLIQSPPGKITGGEIVFHSETQGQVNLANLPEKQIRKLRGNEMGMIFQEPMTSLNPVFTCGDQVMEAMRLHKNLSAKEAKKKPSNFLMRFNCPVPNKFSTVTLIKFQAVKNNG